VFPRLTFAEAAARWLQLYERRVALEERRERTLENYRYHLHKHLLPMLGRRRVQAITPDVLAQLIGHLQGKGLAPKTIAAAHSCHLAAFSASGFAAATSARIRCGSWSDASGRSRLGASSACSAAARAPARRLPVALPPAASERKLHRHDPRA
jgi:hypothetical protein